MEGEGKERARCPSRGCNLDGCGVALRRRERNQSCGRNAGMRHDADGAIWMGQIFKNVGMSNL